MPKITVIARLKAKPGQEERLHKELMNLVAVTHGEKGCINYDLHRNLDDPSEFWFYENWESRQDLDAHLAAPHLVHLDSIAGQLFAEEPELIFLEMVSVPKPIAV